VLPAGMSSRENPLRRVHGRRIALASPMQSNSETEEPMSALLARARAPIQPGLDEAQRVLQSVFGYKAFRLQQAEIIETLLAGGDALALMPTGGGKSLCYQIPALIRPGLGVVVSPLIALMQDQVDALRELGVKAAFLNSTLDFAGQRQVEDQIRTGDLDLLYIAPERLVQDRTQGLLAATDIALFAIDEAHCVSQWGHDFRPEYRQLRVLAERFPAVPRIALTATADARTREEIASELSLGNARRFVSSFDRPNIRYTIAEMGSMGSRERLWRFLDAEHKQSAGIVYCLSRKSVEETATWLSAKGRTALPYHAGLPAEERRRVQQRFLKEEELIIVATIAFGMGIDKPDVRFVAHLNLPKSIEAYYQETGRAGRDGEPADAWMAYGLQDIVTQRQWLQQSEAGEEHKLVQRRKLDALIGLAEMAGCRRQALLAYFDEQDTPPCGNCDNCLNPPAAVDATVLARKALSAVYRTDQRFGVGYMVDILLGKSDERISRNGHDRLSVFGIGADTPAPEWRSLFRQLIAAGHLSLDDDGYGTLGLTERARPLLRGEESFRMRKTVEAEPRRERKERKAGGTTVAGSDQPLLQALRTLRSRLAQEANVPPYVIFHDRTLVELCQKRPASAAALKDVTGLGARKIERYGAAILEALGQKPRHPLLNNRLSGTVNETLALHLEGQDADAIARARGIERATVLGHFAEAIEAGLVEAKAVIGLDEADVDEILGVFERLGTVDSGRLGPAHAALDGRFDYGTLKCLLAEIA
jgi:ATP-dependent DNA helicase RecQ